MAISKKLLTVLAGLVLMTVLLLQCDLDAQAANHNYLSDYTGGAAAVLDARSTNTSKVLNATAKELNLDLDSLSREEESTLVMANVTSALNVRTEPATDAEKAGKLYKDCGGKILERKDGWTKIQSGDLIGWASDEYLLFGEDAESLAADVGVTVAHIDDGLMVRTKPGTDADIYGVLPKGDEVEVLSVGDDGWACIDYEGEDGYVSTDYVVLSETVELPTVAEPVYGKVTEGPLNVRSAPSTDSEKVDSFSTGKVLTILETLDGWYKVEEGYVSADYVTIIDAAEAASSGSASEVVDLAMQYLGYPYCYGGSSPSGFDCSGFVRYVYSQFGCSLNRTASAQMSNGTSVSMSELQPGDLVFFLKSGSGASRASHVGIYIGGGQFIHASTSSTGVIISDMDSAYYTTGFVGGRRIL